MLSKRTSGAVIASFAIAFLLATPAYATASTSNTLNLALMGSFIDVGSQKLQMTGGMLFGLTVFGRTLDPTRAQLQFSTVASVEGTLVSGSAKFVVLGTTSSGRAYNVTGSATLLGMNPAFGMPLIDPTDPLACLATTCTSEVPGFLTGIASVQVSGIKSSSSDDHPTTCQSGYVTGKSGEEDRRTTTLTMPMAFESAYLNPFGGPLVMASPDGGCTLTIVAGYNSAVSIWKNVQVGGFVFDATGNLLGQFGMRMHLVEDLLLGSEQDGVNQSGKITLSNFAGSLSYLNSAGRFSGTSVIPTTPTLDCSQLVGLPPGTCTATGSTSIGTFRLRSNVGETTIRGSYVTNWTIPAFAFTSAIAATVDYDD